jgi:hypothetical protein
MQSYSSAENSPCAGSNSVTINNLGPRPRGESDRRGNKFAHVRLQSLACLPVRWLRQIFISEAFPNRRYPQLAA